MRQIQLGDVRIDRVLELEGLGYAPDAFFPASAPWPIRPETRFQAHLGKLFVINYIHNSPPPLMG